MMISSQFVEGFLPAIPHHEDDFIDLSREIHASPGMHNDRHSLEREEEFINSRPHPCASTGRNDHRRGHV
jgi:hypothetical protein